MRIKKYVILLLEISLMITMVSSNGKITAGSVDLEITKNGNICENHT